MVRLILLRFFETYFRHRWLYLIPILIMLLAAGGYFAVAKKQYISYGTLYVQQSSLLSSLTQIQADGVSWRTPTQVALNEISELLQTDAFVRSAIKKTDLEAKMSDGPEAVSAVMIEFRQAVQVQMVGDNLIAFSAKTTNPKLSQQLTAATIEAYTQWKLNGDQQESTVAQSFFAQVIPGYQHDLDQAREAMKAYLEAHPRPLRGDREPQELAEIAQLQAAIDLASKRLENALDKEESAKLAQSQAESNVRQNYLVIDAPQLPLKSEQTLRGLAISGVIFLVIGVLLSVLGIVGSAVLDRSFRFPIDVRNQLDLPVLTVIPDVGRLPAPVVDGAAESAVSPAATIQNPPTTEHSAERSETIAVSIPDRASV
jgi:uncharacterized protein involved in exopolysaccharide biosynthesis